MERKTRDRSRIIYVSSQGIELAPGILLPWSASNLPFRSFNFHPSGKSPWLVSIKSFEVNDKILVLEVDDFYPVDCQSFSDQKIKSQIDRLQFEKLDWYYLSSFLSSFKKSDLMPFILDHPDTYVADRQIREYRYQYEVKPKDLRFVLGGAVTWIELPALSEPMEIRIGNPHILPQFELIKSYFFKSARQRRILLDIELVLQGQQILRLDARSDAIESIDENMVSSLKIDRVLGLQKAPKIVVIDKHLFSADEIFDQYYDEPDANLFAENPLDILKQLTDQGIVRNRKQLEYLAGRKHLMDQKIFLTLAPHFGFLFITTSQSKNHFIWELINSHATYVWSFRKSTEKLETQIKTVEHIIAMIREQGRDHYKSHYQLNLVNVPYEFNVVIHRHADKGVVDPFPGWKYRLEELLV